VSRRQCAKCPWKRGVNPRDIPNGYSVEKHRELESTIQPGFSGLRGRKTMACHETPPGAEVACVGWLVHQLGPGNNFVLRLAVMDGFVDANVETVGPQHACFEDTLPQEAR
jgi:hypothetical protein